MACFLGLLVDVAAAGIQVPDYRLASIEVHCILVAVAFLIEIIGHNILERALLGLATDTHEHN